MTFCRDCTVAGKGHHAFLFSHFLGRRCNFFKSCQNALKHFFSLNSKYCSSSVLQFVIFSFISSWVNINLKVALWNSVKLVILHMLQFAEFTIFFWNPQSNFESWDQNSKMFYVTCSKFYFLVCPLVSISWSIFTSRCWIIKYTTSSRCLWYSRNPHQ